MIKMLQLSSREEWLAERKNRIGGSEAAAILGLNPYMSNVELWEIKTGRKKPEDISDKPYVKYGIEAEPHIRELFKLNYPQYDVYYVENNMWLNDAVPWAHASLDGWIYDQRYKRTGIWECKTSDISSKAAKDKWNDRIPDNYYCQLLHYFMVRDTCEFVKLTALLKWEIDGEVYQQLRNYHIEREDVVNDIKMLRDAEEEFFRKNIGEDIRPNLILPSI